MSTMKPTCAYRSYCCVGTIHKLTGELSLRLYGSWLSIPCMHSGRRLPFAFSIVRPAQPGGCIRSANDDQSQDEAFEHGTKDPIE